MSLTLTLPAPVVISFLQWWRIGIQPDDESAAADNQNDDRTGRPFDRPPDHRVVFGRFVTFENGARGVRRIGGFDFVFGH